MRAHVVALAAALLATACTSCTTPSSLAPPVTVPPSAVELAVHATVEVRDGGLCAGVHLGNGVVLTAAHCVDSNYVEVVADGEAFEYYAERVDEVADLALLSPWHEAIDIPHLTPAFCAPEYGDHVVAVGHPRGLMFTATAGIVSRPKYKWDGGRFVLVDAIAWPGNSGGPLIDSSGSLVGIASMLPVAGLPLFVHLDAIREFLRLPDRC